MVLGGLEEWKVHSEENFFGRGLQFQASPLLLASQILHFSSLDLCPSWFGLRPLPVPPNKWLSYLARKPSHFGVLLVLVNVSPTWFLWFSRCQVPRLKRDLNGGENLAFRKLSAICDPKFPPKTVKIGPESENGPGSFMTKELFFPTTKIWKKLLWNAFESPKKRNRRRVVNVKMVLPPLKPRKERGERCLHPPFHFSLRFTRNPYTCRGGKRLVTTPSQNHPFTETVFSLFGAICGTISGPRFYPRAEITSSNGFSRQKIHFLLSSLRKCYVSSHNIWL